MDEMNLPAKLVSDLDQNLAVHEGFARNLAAYYLGLVDNGVAPELIEVMVIEANRYLWAKLTGTFYTPKDVIE